MSSKADAAVAASPEPDPVGPSEVETPPSGHVRARSVVATVLGVLAVILLVVGVVAVWAHVTVLRSEPVAELVGDAIAEPEVQAALAAFLADEVQGAVDLESRLADLLPSELDRFASTIAGATNAAVERALGRVLSTPAVQETITTLVERTHARAMRLLEGGGLADGINVDNGEVSINLLPLMAQGLTTLQSATGLLEGVDIPELSAGGDPDEQAAQLSVALGRDLPGGVGQLVVYRSDSVANAQEAVQNAQRLLVLAKRALWLILIGAALLVAATIVLAPRRLRATLVLAVGTAAAMVLLRSVVREVVSGSADLAARPGAKAAVRSMVGGAGASLLRVAGVLLLIALVTVAVVVLRRRRWRDDLVLVSAVLLGAMTVALIGVSIWALLIGIVVGVAVPFAARWAVPARSPTIAGT